MDSSIPPGRVLHGQAKDDLHGSRRQSRSAGASARVGPSSSHQVPMPAEQGLGLNEEVPAARRREQSAQAGEHRSIRRAQRGACDLAAQHRDLVAEDDHFDGQFAVVASLKPQHFKDSNKRQIE